MPDVEKKPENKKTKTRNLLIAVISVFTIGFVAVFLLLYNRQPKENLPAAVAPAQESPVRLEPLNDTPAGIPKSTAANYDRRQAAIDERPIEKPATQTSGRTVPTARANTKDSATVVPTTQTPAGPTPDTFILSGPDQTKNFEGEEVTFVFGGSIYPQERISFQTRLLGVNDTEPGWTTTASNKLTYRLNTRGVKTLLFQVRARTPDGRVDPTPATWQFSVAHSSRWGDVTISSVNAGVGDSNIERVIIRNRTRESINITRWSLNDLTSRIAIPQAVDVLQPRAALNYTLDIILPSYGTLTVNSQTSHIGFSYRENRCTSLIASAINKEKTLDQNTAYETCYYDRRFETNFLQDRWQVYLSLSSGIWDQKSVMVLRDESGAAVDTLEYGF